MAPPYYNQRAVFASPPSGFLQITKQQQQQNSLNVQYSTTASYDGIGCQTILDLAAHRDDGGDDGADQNSVISEAPATSPLYRYAVPVVFYNEGKRIIIINIS